MGTPISLALLNSLFSESQASGEKKLVIASSW